MKKSLFLIAAIALVTVAAFGVKFTTHRSDRAADNKQVTQQPAFAMYQNAQYGFSFSYPSEWAEQAE